MKQSVVWFAAAALSVAEAKECTPSSAIPAPSGQYNVGARRLVVDFVNEDDPTSTPNNASTEYLATIYYPTRDEPAEPAPYLEPELAQAYADLWAYNISHLTATTRWNASFLSEPAGPTLLFGPGGYGPPTDGYRIQISELVSQGYVVAAIDHIREQPFLRLPNGTAVYGLPLDFNPPGETLEEQLAYFVKLHDVRVRELEHFVDYLPELAAEWEAPFETTGLGAFGHSLGGSAALAAALDKSAITAALNVDGTNWGSVNSTDADLGDDRSSFLLGIEVHIPDNDSTWKAFSAGQSGWWRWMTVLGSSHLDWSDATYWKEFGTSRPLGDIKGKRMVEVTNAYINAFFDARLRGEEGHAILDGPSDEFPEVVYWGGSE